MKLNHKRFSANSWETFWINSEEVIIILALIKFYQFMTHVNNDEIKHTINEYNKIDI